MSCVLIEQVGSRSSALEIKMSRSQRKQLVYCLEHEFSLTPLRPDVHLKQTAVLSYCKGKTESKIKDHHAKKQREGNCSSCPIFNKDKNHATNSFILPEEQQNFIENSQKLKLEHYCRVCDYNDQKSKILIPKPKTRYSYCNVCRTSYTDYLEHIQNQAHKNNISKSKFTHYIRDIQKKYQGKDRMKKMPSKSTQTPSTIVNNSSLSEFNGEQFGNPSKMVKIPKGGSNELNNNNNGQNLSLISGFPIQSFPSNIFYSPLPYNYQHFARINQPIQMMPTMTTTSYSLINPFNYHVNCMMLGMPCFCCYPYHAFYPTIHYNQYKPLVIDLQEKQD